ncbi:hypothetical protein [Legionella gresilensis]|uniref:hypothetical protein n=1 Tax=Legionella gresilensis TaxID=91823 RepID=UPI0010418874|nr:hypothetical protein [Legionella gresilensis]
MRSPIYIYYGSNKSKVLLVSCYHDKSFAYSIYITMTNRYKNDDLNKFQEMKKPEEIPIGFSSNLDKVQENLEKEITKKIAAIVNGIGVHNILKVIFLADINLCVNDYNIATCLLDDTLPKLLAQGGILLERTLESSTGGVVQEGVNVYKTLVEQSRIKFKSTLYFREKAKSPIESIKTDENWEQIILLKREDVEREIREKGPGSVILIPELDELEPDPDPGDNLGSKSEEGEKIEGSDVSKGDAEHNTVITSETEIKAQILSEIVSIPNDAIHDITRELEGMKLPEEQDNKKAITQ